MSKKKGCPTGTKNVDGKCVPYSKATLNFKKQIVKAPKGWGQWYTQPIANDKIEITWAKPKHRILYTVKIKGKEQLYFTDEKKAKASFNRLKVPFGAKLEAWNTDTNRMEYVLK